MSVLSLVGILSGVQYIIFGPLVMHVQFVAAAVGAMRWLASMFGPPDGDMYEEDFAEQRDLRQTATATDRQTVPGSAAARLSGSSPQWVVAQLDRWLRLLGLQWHLLVPSCLQRLLPPLGTSHAFPEALAGRGC